MGFHSQSFTNPPRGQPRFPSTTARRPDDRFFLDRWTPRTDPDHERRVELWRKRKHAITRHLQTQASHQAISLGAHSDELQDGRTWSRASFKVWSIDINSFSLEVSSCNNDSFRSSLNTDTSQPCLSTSDLAPIFQDEIDNYDDQIRTLHQNEWADPPKPKASARRLVGSEFSQQTAKSLQAWSHAQGLLYGEQSATLREQDRVHPAESSSVGAIFSTASHAEFRRRALGLGDGPAQLSDAFWHRAQQVSQDDRRESSWLALRVSASLLASRPRAQR
jgi:hypothetical protein